MSRRHKARVSTVAHVTLITPTAAITAASATVSAAAAVAAAPVTGGTRSARTVRGGIAAREPVRKTPAADAAGGGVIARTRTITRRRTAPRSAVRPIRQPIDQRRYAADREQKPHSPVHPKTPLAGPKAATMTASLCRICRQNRRIRSLIIGLKYGTFQPDRRFPLSFAP